MNVSGDIFFRQPPQDLSRAVIRVRLLDTTMADAPSVPISEVTLRGRDLGGPEALASGIRYELSTPKLESTNRYEIAVHVDVEDTGEISAGDYLTTAAHPVPTGRDSAEVDVQVRRI